MQYEKGIDPTLAVYAAYAYADLQEVKRISEMSALLRREIGATIFDLELLGRGVLGRAIEPRDRIVPFVPVLSQGWSLLSAHRVRLHPRLRGIETSLLESLWSMFDKVGLEKLAEALLTGEVR